MSRYDEERAFPHTPLCSRSPFSLRFDGRALRGFGSKTPLLFHAVSGKPDEKGRFDYSAQRQRIRNLGPIPAGNYWVQPSQLWENNWLKSALRSSRSAWGNSRLTIHPYPNTETHGRGGFFIHGGTTPGSAGCMTLFSTLIALSSVSNKSLEGFPNDTFHLP